MLDALRKFFDTKKTEDVSIRNDNPNFVTRPDKIFKIIGEIGSSPHLCMVSFKGSRKTFSTSILEFHPDKDYLILDELRPVRGNAILRNKRSLKLSTFLDGVNLAFKLDICECIDKLGTPNFKAALPNRIYYPQRRTAPRIFIHSTALKFHKQFDPEGITLTGTVFDLSRNGACINFSDTHGLNIERGNVLKDCRIILPGEFFISFDLSVRFTRMHHLNKNRIGGYFTELSPQNQKKLDGFIAKLEREVIRNQRNFS